jgi:hypothetical protein
MGIRDRSNTCQHPAWRRLRCEGKISRFLVDLTKTGRYFELKPSPRCWKLCVSRLVWWYFIHIVTHFKWFFIFGHLFLGCYMVIINHWWSNGEPWNNMNPRNWESSEKQPPLDGKMYTVYFLTKPWIFGCCWILGGKDFLIYIYIGNYELSE